MSTPASTPDTVSNASVSVSDGPAPEAGAEAPTPVKAKKAKKPWLRWLPIGERSAHHIGAGEKTSVIVDLAEVSWLARAAPGWEFEFRAMAWPKDRKKEQPRVAAKALVRVVGRCRHTDLAAVPGCGSHDPGRIRPGDSDWSTVLDMAVTRGRKRVPAAAIDAVSTQGRWLIVDFEIVDFTEVPAPAAGPPVQRRRPGAVERQIAEARSVLEARKAAREDSPELAADQRRLQLLESAYAFRLHQVTTEGGNAEAITIDDLDFLAAAQRLERNAAKRAEAAGPA